MVIDVVLSVAQEMADDDTGKHGHDYTEHDFLVLISLIIHVGLSCPPHGHSPDTATRRRMPQTEGMTDGYCLRESEIK